MYSQQSQPLAIALANERFRQQAIDVWLTDMKTNPTAISRDLGGELWLNLSDRAFQQLKEGSASDLSCDELIEGLRAGLNHSCQLVLDRDQQKEDPVLKIYTEQWLLIAKPNIRAWVVVFIKPQTIPLRDAVIGLPWRLFASGHDANGVPSPLPLWLLSRAQVHYAFKVRPKARTLANLDQAADEGADAACVRTMRHKLPKAVQDLNAAFDLLRWERQHRDRLSWLVTLEPLNEMNQVNGRCSYIIDHGRMNEWQERSRLLALGLEQHAKWVYVAPDSDSPSGWLLHGPVALPRKLTLYELPEDEYRRQAKIASRLADPSKIEPEDISLAATLIDLPTPASTTVDFGPLPGEEPWEPRQQEAIQIALAGHSVCAIKGPPGTGKSTVIVGLLRRAINAKQRVLLVAPTHVALDEVLGRVHDLREKNLERSIFPARVAPADERRIKPELQDYIARNLGRNLGRKSIANVQDQIRDHTVSEITQSVIVNYVELIDKLSANAIRCDNDTRAMAAAENDHTQQQNDLNAAKQSLENIKEQIQRAERKLKREKAHEKKTSKNNPAWEFIFSEHKKAKKAVKEAEKDLDHAKEKRDSVEKSIPPAEARVVNAYKLIARARDRANESEYELRELLLSTELTIRALLNGKLPEKISELPKSLRTIIDSLKESVRSETAPQLDSKAVLSQRVEVLRELSAAMDSEMDCLRRRRELLHRWKSFYEHVDSDDEVTDWALDSVNLVAATTQGIAGSKEFLEHHFDLVICDESSRVTRGEILVPANRAARIVLVGDDKQLPPYVEADDEQLIQALTVLHLSESRAEAFHDMAQRLCDEWNVDEPEFRPVRVNEVCERARTLMVKGTLPDWPRAIVKANTIEERLRAWRRVADVLTRSCFDHVLDLLPAKRTARLNVQRRMVAEIATLVCEPVYGGDYQSSETFAVAPLLTEAFRHAWMFLNTQSYCAARPDFREKRHGTGFVNEGEARAVVLALKQHVITSRRSGEPINGLMVITFYLAQARYIKLLVCGDKELKHERIDILPIDRCQGQEADVVVVSFVRTLRTPRPNTGRWLQDAHRLNVAFTRARRSLLLVGNLQTLTSLRGDEDGEKILAHLGRCIREHPDHQIEQLRGL